MDSQSLLNLARQVMQRAYAPYSKFKVGAAILTAEQNKLPEPKIFIGCNVENSAYPQCLCAEHNAIGHMIAAGNKQILAIAIVNEQKSDCLPCGGCRQLLAEFSSTKTQIHTENQTLSFPELLPYPFKLK